MDFKQVLINSGASEQPIVKSPEGEPQGGENPEGGGQPNFPAPPTVKMPEEEPMVKPPPAYNKEQEGEKPGEEPSAPENISDYIKTITKGKFETEADFNTFFEGASAYETEIQAIQDRYKDHIDPNSLDPFIQSMINYGAANGNDYDTFFRVQSMDLEKMTPDQKLLAHARSLPENTGIPDQLIQTNLEIGFGRKYSDDEILAVERGDLEKEIDPDPLKAKQMRLENDQHDYKRMTAINKADQFLKDMKHKHTPPSSEEIHRRKMEAEKERTESHMKAVNDYLKDYKGITVNKGKETHEFLLDPEKDKDVMKEIQHYASDYNHIFSRWFDKTGKLKMEQYVRDIHLMVSGEAMMKSGIDRGYARKADEINATNRNALAPKGVPKPVVQQNQTQRQEAQSKMSKFIQNRYLS